jgi:[protein-PII] uridylyltransferase
MKGRAAPSPKALLAGYSSELERKLRGAGVFLPGEGDRSAYVTVLKAVLQEGRERIREIHLAGGGGAEVVQRITAWTDAVLMELFNTARRFAGIEEESVRCALVAIGGYGRGELNPYSDLDVMFLTHKEIDPVSRDLSEHCLYLMWDLNLDVGHSIRTIANCVDLAATDIKGKTSLIESRFLAGHEALYGIFRKESRQKIVRRNAGAYLKTKISDVHDRNRKFGNSLYVKEPHVKEGVGGLRDIHTALWIAKVKYGVDSLAELKDKGILSAREERVLLHSLEFLWKVRNHLHYLSGRRDDALTMDMQEQVAAFFKYKDLKHYLAVERFMRGYYLHARNVRYFTTRLMNRCSAPAGLRRIAGIGRRKKTIAKVFALMGDQLCLPDGAGNLFQQEPVRLMEIFALSQRYRAPLADATQEKIVASLGKVGAAFRSDDGVREQFLRILRATQGVTATLRQMHELRLLGKYIPEFGALTALVQHELYHTYTVDEHSLVALEHFERLRGSPYPEQRFYSMLVRSIEKPEIVYVALLLHDIGKAMGEGHVHKGGKAIPVIMDRMGIAKGDSRVVEFLVRNHLVLSHLSQRRDMHDPGLIAQLARVVGDEERLNMLTLVTYCDSQGVGPGGWNDWKDTLLRELHGRIRKQLAQEGESDAAQVSQGHLDKIRSRLISAGAALPDEGEMTDILDTLPVHYLLSTRQSQVLKHVSMIGRVQHEGFVTEWDHYPDQGYTELNICTYDSDSPGFFSRIAGVLAARGINILGARIFTTRQGVVIDCVHLAPQDEQKRLDPEYWAGIDGAVRTAVERTSNVEQMLTAQQSPSYMVRRKGRPIPPRVFFDNTVSDQYTVIDVHAEDRIGLLYTMTSCLAAQGVYIHSAKVTTEQDRAIDAFYVSDVFGHKIVDEGKCRKIRAALLAALQEESGEKH